MNRRTIDREDRALWRDAMRDVVPHRETKKVATRPRNPPVEACPVVPAKSPGEARAATRGGRSSPIPDPPIPEAGAERETLHAPTPGLDRRTALRLKRGQLPVEARLDLHGLTQEEAHGALAAFVARGQGSGKRVLLIVTGKGSREGTGVLRAAVPRWLKEPALAGRVLSTAVAAPRDGGDGALYVLLRRER